MAVLLRLWPYLRGQRLTLLFAWACMALLAVSGAGLAYLSGPSLQLMFAGERAASAGPAAWTQSLPQAWQHVLQALTPSAARLPYLLVANAVLKGAAQAGQFYLLGRASLRVQAALRADAFAALLQQSPRYFAQASTGDLLSRLTADAACVERAVFYGLGAAVRDSMALLALFVFCLCSDLRLALLAFVAGPLVALPLSRFARWLKKVSRRGQGQQGEMTQVLHQAIAGVQLIQSCQREAFEEQQLQKIEAHYETTQRRSYWLRAWRTPVMEILGSVATAVLLVYLGRQVRFHGADPAHFVSFLAALVMMYDPIKKLGAVSDYLAVGAAATERLLALVQADCRVPQRADAASLPQLPCAVQFEDVQFAYQDKPVLRGLRLQLRAGERLALVGASGAGKSTVARLLLRFWDVDAGCIRIGAHDIRDVSLASLRAHISLVSQDIFLFAASAADNIAYGRPGATRVQVEAAARAAHAWDFLLALPQGLDTPLGEGGSQLSGGQRQRIAIARALLRDAPLLVLDEATSALDAHSENQVQAALDQLMRNRTTLIIAHRMTTVRAADAVAVMAAGQVVQYGAPAELARCDGPYQQLLQASHSHVAAAELR